MTPSELSAWRKSERTRLLREREALAPERLAELRSRIDHHLERAFPDLVHGILAFCWPYRNEYDARHLAAAMRRLQMNRSRPLLVGNVRARWQELAEERRPYYEEVAQLTIATDSLSASDVAALIAEELETGRLAEERR